MQCIGSLTQITKSLVTVYVQLCLYFFSRGPRDRQPTTPKGFVVSRAGTADPCGELNPGVEINRADDV